MKTFPRLFALWVLWTLSGSALAQAGDLLVIESAGKLVFSVLAGTLLMLAFHFLLSNLGIALGINAIGNLHNKKAVKHRHRLSGERHAGRRRLTSSSHIIKIRR